MPSSSGSDHPTTSSRSPKARGYVAAGVAAALTLGGGLFVATHDEDPASASASSRPTVAAATPTALAATATSTATDAQARTQVQAARAAVGASRSQERTSAATATQAARAAQAAEASKRKAARVKAAKAAQVKAARVKAAKAAQVKAARVKAAKAAQVKATTARASRAGTARQSSQSPRDIGRRLVAKKGWSAAQFSCLDKLWTKESNWTVTADNPTSSAYGIPQALPGHKMATAGAGWRTDAETQITWGLGYIDDVYGTPCSAWSHSRANNWY